VKTLFQKFRNGIQISPKNNFLDYPSDSSLVKILSMIPW